MRMLERHPLKRVNSYNNNIINQFNNKQFNSSQCINKQYSISLDKNRKGINYRMFSTSPKQFYKNDSLNKNVNNTLDNLDKESLASKRSWESSLQRKEAGEKLDSLTKNPVNYQEEMGKQIHIYKKKGENNPSASNNSDNNTDWMENEDSWNLSSLYESNINSSDNSNIDYTTTVSENLHTSSLSELNIEKTELDVDEIETEIEPYINNVDYNAETWDITSIINNFIEYYLAEVTSINDIHDLINVLIGIYYIINFLDQNKESNSVKNKVSNKKYHLNKTKLTNANYFINIGLPNNLNNNYLSYLTDISIRRSDIIVNMMKMDNSDLFTYRKFTSWYAECLNKLHDIGCWDVHLKEYSKAVLTDINTEGSKLGSIHFTYDPKSWEVILWLEITLVKGKGKGKRSEGSSSSTGSEISTTFRIPIKSNSDLFTVRHFLPRNVTTKSGLNKIDKTAFYIAEYIFNIFKEMHSLRRKLDKYNNKLKRSTHQQKNYQQTMLNKLNIKWLQLYTKIEYEYIKYNDIKGHKNIKIAQVLGINLFSDIKPGPIYTGVSTNISLDPSVSTNISLDPSGSNNVISYDLINPNLALDTTAFDTTGLDTTGFYNLPLDTTGFDNLPLDTTGFDITGFDINALDTTGFDITGFDINAFENLPLDTNVPINTNVPLDINVPINTNVDINTNVSNNSSIDNMKNYIGIKPFL